MMKFNFTALTIAVLFCIQATKAKVTQLTKSNFDEVTAGKTVLIKFFAPWVCLLKGMDDDRVCRI
jgi:hypothetical protein